MTVLLLYEEDILFFSQHLNSTLLKFQSTIVMIDMDQYTSVQVRLLVIML